MEISVPGDKSISHRALLLAALADGRSRVTGLLAADDPRSLAGVLRALGAGVPDFGAAGDAWAGAEDAVGGAGPTLEVDGVGIRGLRAPPAPLDCGNSGTAARLLLGVLAGHDLRATLTGDESLRSRPMARVTDPLEAMGASFRFLEEEDRLPVEVLGGGRHPLEYALPVASAQVKSALLLAGLVAGVPVRLTEPGPSRDHTERMLSALGAEVSRSPEGGGYRVELTDPPASLAPLRLRVPGDFSSAAFPLVLGLLGGGPTPLVLRGVGINPTRTGLLDVLERMGGVVEVEGRREEGGEPVADLVVRPARLAGTEVEGREIPAMIDEVPVLAAAAARAEGETRITGAGELRVKESDRIRLLVDGLRAVGVEAGELDDGLVVRGTDAPLEGEVRAGGDHRIAMAFGVLGALPGCRIRVDRPECVGVSYPGFWETLRRLADGIAPAADRAGRPAGPPAASGSERPPRPRGVLVTLDGPAGSGKSTTAREVARRLGYLHLDSGGLYRALTRALLDADVPPGRWPELTREDLDRYRVGLERTEEGLVPTVGGRPTGEELRGPEVTEHVSRLASLPAVRAWLLDVQREVGREGGLVADGRDMGTVVFPDAEVKVFLVADLDERARRRLLQRGEEAGPERVSRERGRIRERDRQDSEREISPLRRPEGAMVLDTTRLTFEEQVEAVLERVRRVEAREPGS